MFFASKDNKIDVVKKYKDLIQKLIRKHSEEGFVSYHSSLELSKEINRLLETGFTNLRKNDFKNALSLAQAVLRPMIEAIEYGDDSSGRIGECIEKTVSLFENIASSPVAANDIKEDIFIYLQTELSNKIYFAYAHWGYDLLSIFQNLATQLHKPGLFLGFLDAQIAMLTEEDNNYLEEVFQKSKIEFLQQTGRTAEAEKLVQQNLNIVEVRQNEVNKAIRKKDYYAAKKLINDGIKVAQSNNHAGTVIKWQENLLKIAVLEKDIATVKYFTKKFAFDGWFSADYYKQWKANFSDDEWPNEIQKHIEETINRVMKEWNSNKNKFWRPAHPPLLASLGPIYVQEKYWDLLLSLLQQENNLNTVLEYHPHLAKQCPSELVTIYLPLLKEYGIKSGNRSEYAALVNTMQKIMKDIPEGRKKLLDLANELKEKFSSKPRRPAMMDELERII